MKPIGLISKIKISWNRCVGTFKKIFNNIGAKQRYEILTLSWDGTFEYE